MQYGQEHYKRYNAVDVRKYSMHWWANRYYVRVLRGYVPGGRLLEIGCGTGFFLAELGRYFETCGIDTSPFALKHARDNCPRADIRCMRGEDIAGLGPDFFDAVVSRHVFEHMEEPGTVLEACYRVLRPGGVLLYVVPNTESIARRWKGPDWYGYRDDTHVSLLSPGEWADLTAAAGFTLEKAYSDGLWDVPYVRYVPNPVQKCVFGSLGGLQALLSRSFMPLPLGEALIIIARKPTR
ncbi:MAG: class I SAM-dependent methyltransferase [Actinomycetota bacterium]|nr:class I SAM-dependent methyltransferase [Actinomycetota bacterium]MDD5667929.1 class I SAM-dependent methyltransferase [Actinomycetota bacterium]